VLSSAPSSLITWVAQAMQGSKECSVRRDFHGLIGDGHRRVHQRGLESTDLTLGVTRAAVPGAGHDALVVLDLAVLDPDPVAECAAWRGNDADPFGLGRPGGRVPFSTLAVEESPALMLAIISLKSSRIISAQLSDSSARASVRPMVVGNNCLAV